MAVALLRAAGRGGGGEGAYGVEVWATVMRLFVANPCHTWLVRGNHEVRQQL